MNNIAIIGAGNIGSRHLQAIKRVNLPLNITVIDSNPDSLEIAEQRFNSMNSGHFNHKVKYLRNTLNIDEEYEIVIIATNANARREIIEQLLEKSSIKYLILEKILFQKSEDYYAIKSHLEENKIKAWVNCTRRIIPFYSNYVKNKFNGKQLIYFVSGSNWGLISNIIHYIDYVAYLLDCDDFVVDLSHLHPNLIESIRVGFLELNGTINLFFNDGSICVINCYPSGNQPMIVDIASDEIRCIINETEGKAWVTESTENSRWEEHEAKLLYTSQVTTYLVEDILNTNNCQLTPFNESMKLHLLFFEPLLDFLNKNSNKQFSYYPFT